MWKSPYYRLKAKNGKYIFIDVTTSCAPGLKPNKVIIEIAKFLKRKKADKVLDFGAGSLRHTFPLLKKGFQVFAVEFNEQFKKPSCQKALRLAKRSPNFSALIFPGEFIKDKRKFDAALLAFVIPTMPLPDERRKLLKLIKKKLKKIAFIFWMSQYGKYGDTLKENNKVKDGWYLNPKRKKHSFYTEFKNADIDEMFKKIGFERIRVLSERGCDQFRLYSRGGGTWP